MGTNLIIISVGSLLIMILMDFFTRWYAGFLKRWMPHFRIRVLLGRLVWTILAVTFWWTLYRNHLSELLSPASLFFVLFIYSVRGLIISLFRDRGERSIYY